MDATPEEWRPVVGYEGYYEVSDQGQIRSLDRVIQLPDGRLRNTRGQQMQQQWNRKVGKFQVTLRRRGKRETFYVHMLVATAFHGHRPEGLWACHKNDDSRDNRAENLRWDTPSSNHHDMVNAGNHHYAKRTQCANGHEYTPENTRYEMPSGAHYVNPNPTRRCLTCQQINNQRKRRPA